MSTAKHPLLLGAHISAAGGFYKAIERGASIGCTTLQIFTKSNRQWHAQPLDEDEILRFKKAQQKFSMPFVVAHASYLINIGSPNPDAAHKATAALIVELQRCEALNIPYLVLHPGSHVNTDETACLDRIAVNLSYAFEKVPGNTTILLETMAGQGSSTCSTFEQIAHIIKRVIPQSRVGVCMDTCHIFAAGYDFRTEDLYKKMWHNFDHIIGKKYLKVIHMNDSKKECGSRVDRHEDIGKGKIGLEAFSFFMNDESLSAVAKIVETPVKIIGEALKEHRYNMDTLENLVKRRE